MAYVFNVTALNAPPPQVVSGYMYPSDYYVNTGVPNGITARFFNKGSQDWTKRCNINGALAEITAQCGAGQIGIVTGLVASIPVSGLVLPITAGIALIGAVVSSKTALSATLNNNTTNYVYYKQDGTIEVVNASLTPPAGLSALIVVATTSAGAITVLDGSGVNYINSGHSIRKTGDEFMPTDVPPSNWLGYTVTQNGTYFWNGSIYERVGNRQQVKIYTTNHTITTGERGLLFTNEGSSGTVNFTLPPAVSGGEGPFMFIVEAAHTLQVTANTGDTIRIAGSVSASAGNITNATIGGTVTLVCINATEWVALSHEGTWTVT